MISIVVTTYKRPVWLRECLASIPAGVTTIVVDDAERHEGYALARLRGLEQVTTEFVAFLDDDDVLLPNWLPLHLAAMDGHDIVAGSYFETDALLRSRVPVVLATATVDGLASGFCPVNDGALVRRSVLDGITWHPERDTAMMLSAWFDLAKAGARFTTVAEPTWLHRLHIANMSAHLDERDAEFRRLALT